MFLELPVEAQTAALDIFQGDLTRINALLEGGTQFHADFRHVGFGEFDGHCVLASRTPGADAGIDLGVIVGQGSRGACHSNQSDHAGVGQSRGYLHRLNKTRPSQASQPN